MSDEILLVVNGKRHTVQAAEGTPLLYVLRNELGLTGPQFGCGEETCGAGRGSGEAILLIGIEWRDWKIPQKIRETKPHLGK